MSEEEIYINGLKINYRIAGLGPAVLILHGWGKGSDSWIEVQKLLTEKGYKVICPDLPGFGKSQKPPQPWGLDNYCDFIEKFIFVLNLEKFYLLGHSFGGALAVKCCLKFPQKIEKLFLIAAACFRRRNFKKRLFFLIAKIFKIFSFLPFYQQIRKSFYKFIVKESDYPYTEGIMRDSYLKIIKEDLENVLEKIQVPVIIIWGEKDKIKKLKEAQRISKEIKNSKLKILENVGHNPHSETPQKLAETITHFLRP